MFDVEDQHDLEAIIAERLCESHEFRSWLLSRTKFAKLWPFTRLLNKEQEKVRGGAGVWWRSWSASPSSRPGMFLCFEVEQTRLRFALHLACVRNAMELREAEIERRAACGESMVSQERFLNNMDFETVLLAPQRLILGDAHTENFDRRIPFETVAGFVPQFAESQKFAAVA